jgi:ATP-binding cassette subfamily B protein
LKGPRDLLPSSEEQSETMMNTLHGEIHELRLQLFYVPQSLSLIWQGSRRWTVAWLFLVVMEGVAPAILVYLTRPLVDALVSLVGAGWSWQTISPILRPAILMGGIIVLIEILRSLNNWVRTAQSEYVRDYLAGLVHDKSIAVDLGFYESPQFHDRLDRARNELSTRPLALLESMGSLLQNSITVVTIVLLLLSYDLWLPWLLLVSMIPVFFVVVHFNRRYHRWWEKSTRDRRLTQYYDALLTHSEVAAELRLFDLGAFFKSKFQGLRGELRRERIRFTRDQSLARLAAGLGGITVAGLAIGWIGWRAVVGKATVGDIALFYQAIQRGQSLLQSVLENIGQIYSNTLFLGNLFEFLELKPKMTDRANARPITPSLQEAIRFNKVTFGYPGSDRPVLRDFNLVIPAGQVVAIVGSNGAGKSTLLKLLCRFYDPNLGAITVDGHDIRELTTESYRRLLTVLLQSPVFYQTTVSQNIALGDLSANVEAKELERVAVAAGIHKRICDLPNAYETLLGKWFVNGAELSNGERQKLALARAFFRKAPIIILDEPTSALDSWAEADWFERFRSLAQGRTAIIITHRFTIARRADIIHVMDAGQIVESGKHDELLEQRGLYARSWSTQVQGEPFSVKQPSAQIMSADRLLNGRAVSP